ncbi:riboflavin synthase [Lysinibacillus odysseyi]|uniref:Riboflavin synthase n=1 Tax=Lysinibacillus odysseyi 34hs-1 = NBRC 100172 TaxID=1220589 RepID=A0A0A3IQV5_9BACI|nr:riboflavin synthase [Lysinibacillus odysseyi]KGR85805.1 riboflavin synthase subunit alpha [Lysinibacillus odysseyi 34hs-1 = NBRC 100172]
MFTGIIEDIGKVHSIVQGPNTMELTISSSKILSDIHLGDSIAVNGVCLTVTSFSDKYFTVDVMPETVKSTSLQSLTAGSHVNLERAMSANGRFGGHFVSGHVDGTGIIIKKRPVANAVYIDIAISEALSEYCLLKGSITIDGTSLTIFDLQPQQLTVSLIPHTYRETVLGMKKEREPVNIETDLLGKYIINQFKGRQKSSSLTMDFLHQHGF